MRTQEEIRVSDKGLMVNRIFFGAALLVMLTMPLKSNYNAAVQILFLVVFLFKPGAISSLRENLSKPAILAIILFYGLHVLSFFNSDNISLYSKDLVLKSSLLFVPIIFYSVDWTDKQKKQLISAFIFSISLICLYSFGKNYLITFDKNYFSFSGLMNNNWEHFWYMVPIVISFHAPYFSLFLVVALILIWDCFPQEKGKAGKWSMILLTLFLMVFLFFLASRTAIFSFIIIFLVWGSYMIFKTIGFKMVVTFSIVVLTALALGINYSPFLKSKLAGNSGFASRYYMWQAGAKIIQHHPVLGVGTGDVKQELYQE
jgi:O-antigen ligase